MSESPIWMQSYATSIPGPSRATQKECIGRADDKLVGMQQVLLRALDPSELRVSGRDGGPIRIAAPVANVQPALGM